MTEKKESCYSLRFWDQLMGRELPRSEGQPLQPVMIENGKLKLFAGALNSQFPPGAKIGLKLNGNHIVFQEVSDGNPLQEASFWDKGRVAEFRLSEAIREMLPEEDPVFAILLDTGEHLELLPVRVREHDPDVLGPGFIHRRRCG